MPPTFNRTRPKILCWRGSSGPDAETLELIQAQEQVMLTGKVLAVGSDEQAEKLREGIFSRWSPITPPSENGEIVPRDY